LTSDLTALLTHARWMPAEERAEIADQWASTRPAGTVLLATCHRVELYGSSEALSELGAMPGGAHVVTGRAAAEHIVRVAVGRD